MSLTIRSLMSFFTLVNGSTATLSETIISSLLPLLCARSARKSAMRFCSGAAWSWSLRSCARAVPLGPLRSCSADGKCLSPAPATALPDMISIALFMASSSLLRSFCLLSKSVFLSLHSASVSKRYVLSSARSAVICARSPSASALACSVSPLVAVFLEISWLAFSMLSASCCTICSKACCAFFSSISVSYFFWLNSDFSFLSMSTMPPDWNS
mmetsp:Transcript_18305/g.48295  ORF Transcript_18305/g.48295 Transcript_18305/m.48295 type:complete len:213 (+) Transcript_18305:879-1517(+)